MQETTLATECICPTCITGPDVSTNENVVAGEYADLYAQTPSNHSGFTIDCNVGVGGLLENQGYTSNGKQYQCWPSVGSWKRDYFGEWKVYEASAGDEWTPVAEGTEVCAPKVCMADALPTIANSAGSITCEGVEEGASTYASGQTCTWECAKGYEVKGTLSCDRGIFVGGAACSKRACPKLSASANQELSKTSSVYQDRVSVSCSTGYELKGDASLTCNVKEDHSMGYSAQPGRCEKLTCKAIGAVANTNTGGCSTDAAMSFGETCSIGCTDGFANADGTKTAKAECSCTSDGTCSVKCGSGSCAKQCSAAVTCSGGDAKADNTADAGTCAGSKVEVGKTCTRTCKAGYTIGGTRDGKTALAFTCSDVEGTGTLSAPEEKCAERVCDATKVTGVKAAKGTISAKAGTVTAMACSGKGEKLTGATHVKCSGGSYIGCADEKCSKNAAMPTCLAEGVESEVVPVVTFEMEFAMDTSWVSPKTCGKAKTSIAETFCGKAYMDCKKNGIELTVTGLKAGGKDPCASSRQLGSMGQRQLQADALKVEFEAKAKAGVSAAAATSALTAATSAVAKIEKMDTSEVATLSTALSTDLTATVGVEVKVKGVVVTQAARKVEKVVVKEAAAASGGGLGGGAIAGIVIAILVVVGGGLFLMKKGGGGGDRA